MNIYPRNKIMKRQTLTNIQHSNINDILCCCMLVIPFASHWILPDGLERNFYISLLGIPFYLPNLCYFLYLIYYKRQLSKSSEYLKKRTRNGILTFVILLLLLGIFSSLTSGFDVFLPLIFDNLSLVWASVFFLLFPMNSVMIENTKYVIIPTAVIISLEIILFGFGILTYEADLGDQEYEGIIRISTTVGAATGTATALTMIGCLIIGYYNLTNVWKISLGLLISAGILFSVSRGPIAMWGAFILINFYRVYFHNSNYTKKLKYLSVGGIAIFLLFSWGAFDPVIKRTQMLAIENEIDTGRRDLESRALNMYRSSDGIGVGNGVIQVDKSLNRIVDRKHHVGVHSYYISTLAESGFLGITLTVLYFAFLAIKFDYSYSLTYFALMLFLLSFSTEPIYTQAEFMSPAFFVFMICLKRNRKYESVIR